MVLQLVTAGRRNREIAPQLQLCEATIKSHLLHILDKLGADDRTQAVTVAREPGILRMEH